MHPDFHPITNPTALTIILPHKRNPGNDAALKIALDCLFENTTNDFHLLIDAAQDKPLYRRIHDLMLQATTEAVVYTTSDSFHAPGWDVPMLAAFAPNRLVYGVVAEPGMLGVFPGNVHADFGRRPERFDRHDFELWATMQRAAVPSGYGFPAPIMYPRTLYLEHDYPLLDQPDFYPRDDMIIDRMVAAGVERVRVPSYFYHLGRYSDVGEQTAAKRD